MKGPQLVDAHLRNYWVKGEPHVLDVLVYPAPNPLFQPRSLIPSLYVPRSSGSSQEGDSASTLAANVTNIVTWDLAHHLPRLAQWSCFWRARTQRLPRIT